LTSSEHTSIVDAIEGKDAEGAAASMQKHLDRVGTTVEELLAENDGEIG
jgi:DNA-binding GntR family transcriptional regulator